MLDPENVEVVQSFLEDFEQVWPLFQNRGITRSSALNAFIGICQVEAIKKIEVDFIPPDYDEFDEPDADESKWKKG